MFCASLVLKRLTIWAKVEKFQSSPLTCLTTQCLFYYLCSCFQIFGVELWIPVVWFQKLRLLSSGQLVHKRRESLLLLFQLVFDFLRLVVLDQPQDLLVVHHALDELPLGDFICGGGHTSAGHRARGARSGSQTPALPFSFFPKKSQTFSALFSGVFSSSGRFLWSSAGIMLKIACSTASDVKRLVNCFF